jgi:hypothetical protein
MAPPPATAAGALPICGFVSTRGAAVAYNRVMRRIVLWLFALLVVAGAGYTAYWFHMANRLRAGVEPWAEARRAQGYAVGWSAVAVGGFPATFRLRFTDATFAAARPFPVTLSGPALVGEAKVWDLQRWALHAAEGGRAELTSSGEAFTAAGLDGTLVLDDPAGTAIDFTAHDVTTSGVVSGVRIADLEAKLSLPRHPARDHRDTSVAVSIGVSHATLPWSPRPFGSDIETLSLAGTLKGALPPGQLRASLDAWRADGGTVELEQATLRWGRLDATANGTLALDAALQPVAALTATIENQDAIVDAAVANGGLPAGRAGVAKTVLGLLSTTDSDGRKHLRVPLSLQNERVYLGPVPIGTLPHFTWE